MLDWMRTDPIGFFTYMLYRAPAVLLALMLHEIAHGYVAYRCGDPTARNLGRLTLNPFKHLSLIGTILMFTAGMGWAKPVPVNPYNYRHGRRDDVLVSIAGVTTNFILFCLSTILSVLLCNIIWQPALFELGYECTNYFDFLSFNGVNFLNQLHGDDQILLEAAEQAGYYYSADASLFLKTPWLLHVQRFLSQFAMCNLGMCLFNLLPFPPLDGFHVFNDILLGGKLQLNRKAFQTCMLVLLLVMTMTDVVYNILSVAIDAVQSGVLSLCLSLFGGM